MGIFSNDGFKCGRCGRKDQQMAFAPFPNELGQRVYNEICQVCWKEWLAKQNQLVNHFGIDFANPEAHEFLFDQLKIFLFNEGVELTKIDTSKEGSINW
jgi:Fe-S cluster biosynthesis and repair protein YggX